MENSKSESQNSFMFKSNTLTIISLALIATYFILDFADHQDYLIGIAYIVIMGIGAYIAVQKKEFYMSIETLICTFLLGWFAEQIFLRGTKLRWIVNLLTASNTYNEVDDIISTLFSVNYTYIYLVCIFLSICTVWAAEQVYPLFYVLLKNLGKYSCIALLFQIVAMYFPRYHYVAHVIFIVFTIYAFISSYFDEKEGLYRLRQTVLVTCLCSVGMILFAIRTTALFDSIGDLLDVEWYYLAGLVLIAVIALLTKESIVNNLFGISLIMTMLYLYYLDEKNISFNILLLLFFHLFAVSCYKLIINMNCFNYQMEDPKVKAMIIYLIGYAWSFILTVFVLLKLIPAIITMVINVFVLLVYKFGAKDMEAKIQDVVIFGAMPWVMLEVMLDSIGKINNSLFTVIVITIIFWIILGVGLAWKDSIKIPSLAFDSNINKKIIAVLTVFAYVIIFVFCFR